MDRLNPDAPTEESPARRHERHWLVDQARSLHTRPDLYAQIENDRGELQTVILNKVRSEDWQFMIGNIPDHVKPPFSLVSFHMFEPGGDPQAGLDAAPVTPGTLYIDDIIATVGFENEELVLDDFEGDDLKWEAILTSAASTENVAFSAMRCEAGRRQSPTPSAARRRRACEVSIPQPRPDHCRWSLIPPSSVPTGRWAALS